MKRISSIFYIFWVFFVLILLSFVAINVYSAASLRISLRKTAQVQMDFSCEQLNEKLKEIEIETNGILQGAAMRTLQAAVAEKDDIYEYVTAVNAMKEQIRLRQSANSGIAECIFYWPEMDRVVSTGITAGVDREALLAAENRKWYNVNGEVYYAGKYETPWDKDDDEPYVIICMEKDWIYNLKNMASGIKEGGTLCLDGAGQSIFSLNAREQVLIEEADLLRESTQQMWESKAGGIKYQIVRSKVTRGGLLFVTYYPLRTMLRPVMRISIITGLLLLFITLFGTLCLMLYHRNILIQLQVLTKKLQQVEKGDLTAKITELPDNEFHYVFTQFNEMTQRMDELFTSMMREQELRSKAELEQLQLQIHPHFLYNSLAYIVSVADEPEQVKNMAMHLSSYYRYCTKKKLLTTIGEEISYARTYLEIMAMRKHISYEIHVPEKIYSIPVIPLILEPLIENAIEHGIEEAESAGRIRITINRSSENSLWFEVSDDGGGMTEEMIERLSERIECRERREGESVGLWNVNQRLINYYSEESRLHFDINEWGGISVWFSIRIMDGKEEGERALYAGTYRR